MCKAVMKLLPTKQFVLILIIYTILQHAFDNNSVNSVSCMQPNAVTVRTLSFKAAENKKYV
jgi:hypothetical protein